MLLDKEMEALVKCTELIKDLDDQARLRVVKYLVEKFEIGIPRQGQFQEDKNSSQSQSVKHIEGSNDEIEDTSYEDVPSTDYPTLKDLLIKNYPKSEVEWILCYAFYASDYGNETFTKEDIVTGYEENKRYSSSSKANLSNNIKNCVKKDWIKSINDNEFIMKQAGKDYASQVVTGNSTTKERKAKSRKKKEE